MNKKKFLIKFIIIGLISVSIFLPVSPILAQESVGGGTSGESQAGGNSKPVEVFTLRNPLKVDSIGALVQLFVEIITYIVILIAVLMFIYVGFQYVIAASKGEAKKIEDLHKQLFWLVIGVAVVIGARFIIQVVINTLEATGAVSKPVTDSAYKALKGN